TNCKYVYCNHVFRTGASFFTLLRLSKNEVLATSAIRSFQTDIIGLYEMMPQGVLLPGVESRCVQDTDVEKGERDMQSNDIVLNTPVCWGILSAANIRVKRVDPVIQLSSNRKLIRRGTRRPRRA